jgi:hypothetical protein
MINIQQISVAAYGAQTYEPTAKGSGKKVVTPAPSAPRSEQVELSNASLSLNKVRDAIAALPEVRIPLVEEIRQKIKYNGYPMESAFYKAVQKMVANNVI